MFFESDKLVSMFNTFTFFKIKAGGTLKTFCLTYALSRNSSRW
jgi:hypothetical protein